MTGVEANRHGRLNLTLSPGFTDPRQTARAWPSIWQALSLTAARTLVTLTWRWTSADARAPR